MRRIEDILHFRSDLPPFLVHLTRAHEGGFGKDSILSILTSSTLKAGPTKVSDVRFGGYTKNMSDEASHTFFSAVCFTETPLNEIHTLLEIKYRQVHLEPYGLVFMRERLQKRGVAPAFYVNNERGNMGEALAALFELKDSHPGPAARILPMISVFGKKVRPPGAKEEPSGEVDWRWEREWRYPSCEGEFSFSLDDVFIGLCPHDEIEELEARVPEKLHGLGFVDPRRNIKWYATKLIEARQRLDIKHSVV